MCKYIFVWACLACLFGMLTNVNATPVSNIPLIEYHPDTGLVLLDTRDFGIAMASMTFRDRQTGGVGFQTNHFFDNSPGNPLFAAHGGVITQWTSGWNGEDIYGQMSYGHTYSGPLRAWAQISSGLDSRDFLRVRYWADRNGSPAYETQVTIVPEPLTLVSLGLGAMIFKKRS